LLSQFDRYNFPGFQVESTQQYTILTYIITKEWSGKSTKEYKIFKGLRKKGLRDNMTNTELIRNMLAESSVIDFAKDESQKKGMSETAKVAKKGGRVAKAVRREYELQSGKRLYHRLIPLILKLSKTEKMRNK